MGYRYAVVGAGRQGSAAAYDFAQHGDADDILLVDLAASRASEAATRVNLLVGTRVARGAQADVRKSREVESILRDADVFLSAVPYALNLGLARAAIRVGTSMVDLGGNTEIVRRELELDSEARAAGISIVPDCGMGPGLNITLAVYAMGLLDRADDVYIYDGGLPQDPKPPWNYALTFNVAGLTNEYDGYGVFVRNGRIVEVSALTEIEEIDFPPLGRLEAAVTSGGLSTAPWSFLGRVRTFQNKTLRYPGHWDAMRAFRDLGMFRLDAVRTESGAAVPRHLFHALLEPQLTSPGIRDVAVERVRVLGVRGDRPAEAVVQVIDWYDPSTGFTAMERLTGWHAAIAAEMIARGLVPPGAHPIEALPATPFVDEIRRRGISVEERVCVLRRDTDADGSLVASTSR